MRSLQYQQATGVPSVTTCELAALTAPALFDPGERWWYGTNIDFVGLMVEEVVGQRLGDYLDEHVLGPLGMDSTVARWHGETERREIGTSGSPRRRAVGRP